METPKIRIVLLGDETHSEPDSSHLDTINKVLNQLHGNLTEDTEVDEPQTSVMEDPETDNVPVSIPDPCELTGNQHWVHPDVAEYISRLESQLDTCRSLDYSIDRVLRSNYHVHISNK